MKLLSLCLLLALVSCDSKEEKECERPYLIDLYNVGTIYCQYVKKSDNIFIEDKGLYIGHNCSMDDKLYQRIVTQKELASSPRAIRRCFTELGDEMILIEAAAKKEIDHWKQVAKDCGEGKKCQK